MHMNRPTYNIYTPTDATKHCMATQGSANKTITVSKWCQMPREQARMSKL